jgi:hypothetical protein
VYEWSTFYKNHEKYQYLGMLAGSRYFDKDGNETELRRDIVEKCLVVKKIADKEREKKKAEKEKKRKVIVLGGSAVDFEVRVTEAKFELYQSCRGTWKTSFGGVGRNIAEVCSRLGAPTTFVTALGGDSSSADLRSHILSCGIELCEIRD